jgi:hypothetical protein
MGSAMARNLLRAWLQVDVWDRTPEAAARLPTPNPAGEPTLPVAAAIGDRWHRLIDAGLGQADVSAARHGLGQAATTS